MAKDCLQCGASKTRRGKLCNICYGAKYRTTETFKENDKKYKAKIREKLTGFSAECYEQKLIEQEYKCAICHTHISNLKVALAADHDHHTNKPRGLLCTRCNLLLGYVNDDKALLYSAVVYLNEYKE